MKIYVGHSSDINFKEKLYRPLRESKLAEEQELVFPHEDSEEPFDSKNFLRDDCDMMVAEVSKPSTGLGIELGWADVFDVPVLCVYESGAKISKSVDRLFKNIRSYRNLEKLPREILGFIEANEW